jgi:transcriptional regulator with XRE-family HTH domain
MTTLTPKKRRVKEKSPEIQRFVQLLEFLNIKAADLARETDISERTIMNFIWQDMPIGPHLLRELHSKYNVSLDWLLAGKGNMLLSQGDEDKAHEQTGADTVESAETPRARRIFRFIRWFLDAASDDERCWFEVQLKLHVPHYTKFLEQHHD